MKTFIVLCVFVAAAVSQEIYQPIPYSFRYEAPTEDGGSSSREESGDGAGRVSGSYTYNNLEGHIRTVEYIADEGGYRATVRTNEPGTANINPADVVMESSAEANPISYNLGTAGAPATRVIESAPRVMAPVNRIMVPPTRMIASAPRVMRPATRMVRPATRMISPIAAPMSTGRPGVRYVLVPSTDPRARGYY